MHDDMTPEKLALYRQHADDPNLVALTRPDALRALLEDDATPFTHHPVHAQLAITLGARALAHARRAHPEHDDDLTDLLARLQNWVTPLCTATLQGLSLSYYPTARHTCLRFVERACMPTMWHTFFTPEPAPHDDLTAVFVDPEEFHYRTFEYIVPLDKFFADVPAKARLNDVEPLIEGRAWRARVRLDGALRDRLLALDEANLYLPPLNAGSRGGERLIFHASKLARALSKAVRKALPRALLARFSHVNPVFRCNRFSPHDEGFSGHHDTPYSDRARGHISRYTLLIYMTQGSASPALRLGAQAMLDEIEAWTCVIFDQSLEHEGRVFEDNDKIFLRTELVFEVDELPQSPHIASLFARACGLTGEALFDDRVARHVHQAYDRVAQAHFGGDEANKRPMPELFLHRRFARLDYVCNGHDYWFDGAQLSLEACASLVILDHFNCMIAGTVYRKRCASTVLEDRQGTDWIAAYLKALPETPEDHIPAHFDVAQMFPMPPAVNEEMEFREQLYELNDGVVRGIDQDDYFKNPRIVAAYRDAQERARSLIQGAPIMIMGEEVWLDERQYAVHGNKIFVGSQTPMQPLNFAASTYWPQEPEDYIKTKTSITAPYLLIPPLLFWQREDGIVHITCDLFENGWMTSSRVHQVDIPQIEWPW